LSLGFFYYEKSHYNHNFIYHKTSIPIFLTICDILWIVNICYFFLINSENIEIFRNKFKIFSIIVYSIVALVITFGNYFECKFIEERRIIYHPFNEVNQELSSINEYNNVIIT
jgi:hypothetical protein